MFLHIRIVGTAFQVEGDAGGTVGHKIQNPRRTDIDGVFADWSWDGSTLRVRNDRYGFCPVFYFSTPLEIAISDSIDRLLGAGASRDLNHPGIAVFLRLGYFLGDDTAFRQIRMLGPNARLEWSRDRLDIHSAPFIAPLRIVSRREAMSAYIELFRAAVARRGAPVRPVVVPLSGGRDSRHIVLELCRQNLKPDLCITARPQPSTKYKSEVEVAAQLCARLSVRHYVPPPDESLMKAEMAKNALTNYTTSEHRWFMPVGRYLSTHAAVTYDGMAGDVLSAGHFLTPERHGWFNQGQFVSLFRDMQWGLTEATLDRVLTGEARKRFSFDQALARFEAECQLHVDAPNPIGSLSIFNRTRRVACLCAYALQPGVQYAFSPYLDNDLFDFLSSLPAELFMDYAFHTDTIRYAYPDFADVPYAQSRPGTGYAAGYRAYALETAGTIIRAKRSDYIRSTFTLPRLARCLVDARYSPTAAWLADLSIYFMQLEAPAVVAE